MPATVLSSKNQVTIPVAILAVAGYAPGDRLIVEYRDGHIELTRASDVLARLAGTVEFPAGFVDSLRGEWDDRG